jgi:hypothetical protein
MTGVSNLERGRSFTPNRRGQVPSTCSRAPTGNRSAPRTSSFARSRMIGRDDDYVAGLERETRSTSIAVRCRVPFAGFWIGHSFVFRGEHARGTDGSRASAARGLRC